MKWKEKYATGVEHIDNQHKMIFKISEDFSEALEDGKGENIYEIMLSILESYTLAHFKFEKKHMNEHRCSLSQQNKNAHQHFMENIREYKIRYESFGFEESKAFELVDKIDSWLDSHICTIDVYSKKCVEKNIAR